MSYLVTAFYKFVEIKSPEALVQELKEVGASYNLLGTILVASEGINSTIGGATADLIAFMDFLKNKPEFSDLEEKRSSSTERPFYRFKVRLKKEIVTLGLAVDPRKTVGTYVEAEDWNELINDPDTVLIDTRNKYEVDIGRFKNAIDPKTDSFRQFPEWVKQNLDPEKKQKVAMYCTGGIRCEKATSLLKDMGFGDVYHLKGGILKYLEKVPSEDSTWEGSCFLFDNRVGVESGLKESEVFCCPGCRYPLQPEALQDPRYEEGVSCPRCADSLSEEKKERLRERHHQIQLAKARGEFHMGAGRKKKKESTPKEAS